MKNQIDNINQLFDSAFNGKYKDGDYKKIESLLVGFVRDGYAITIKAEASIDELDTLPDYWHKQIPILKTIIEEKEKAIKFQKFERASELFDKQRELLQNMKYEYANSRKEYFKISEHNPKELNFCASDKLSELVMQIMIEKIRFWMGLLK